MATQPDEQLTPPEPQEDKAGGGIGAGTLATAGLALIALAILIWFLYPRFSGPTQPTPEPTPGAVVAELITATPVLIPTASPAPTEVAKELPATVPPSPSATPIPPTPTLPVKVESGVYAKVVGTGAFGLRFRSGPGQDYVTWRILPEGEILKVTGGPQEADGVIWWRAVDQTGLVGWAAEQYLVPVPPPAWTPAPERTPDLTQITLTPES